MSNKGQGKDKKNDNSHAYEYRDIALSLASLHHKVDALTALHSHTSRLTEQERMALRAATSVLASNAKALIKATQQGAPPSDEVSPKEDAIQNNTQGDSQMDADIQKIVDQAKSNDDAEAAAAKAFGDYSAIWQAKIAAASSLSAEDRATLQQTANDMKSSADALAAAVVANTPSA